MRIIPQAQNISFLENPGQIVKAATVGVGAAAETVGISTVLTTAATFLPPVLIGAAVGWGVGKLICKGIEAYEKSKK